MSEPLVPTDRIQRRKLQNKLSARESRRRQAEKMKRLELLLTERDKEIELLKKLVVVLMEQKKRLRAQI
jgi:hypothetical protein